MTWKDFFIYIIGSLTISGCIIANVLLTYGNKIMFPIAIFTFLASMTGYLMGKNGEK